MWWQTSTIRRTLSSDTLGKKKQNNYMHLYAIWLVFAMCSCSVLAMGWSKPTGCQDDLAKTSEKGHCWKVMGMRRWPAPSCFYWLLVVPPATEIDKTWARNGGSLCLETCPTLCSQLWDVEQPATMCLKCCEPSQVITSSAAISSCQKLAAWESALELFRILEKLEMT